MAQKLVSSVDIYPLPQWLAVWSAPVCTRSLSWGILQEFNQEGKHRGAWTLGRNSCQLHLGQALTWRNKVWEHFAAQLAEQLRNASLGQWQARWKPEPIRQVAYGRFTFSCQYLLTSSPACRGWHGLQFRVKVKRQVLDSNTRPLGNVRGSSRRFSREQTSFLW